MTAGYRPPAVPKPLALARFLSEGFKERAGDFSRVSLSDSTARPSNFPFIPLTTFRVLLIFFCKGQGPVRKKMAGDFASMAPHSRAGYSPAGSYEKKVYSAYLYRYFYRLCL